MPILETDVLWRPGAKRHENTSVGHQLHCINCDRLIIYFFGDCLAQWRRHVRDDRAFLLGRIGNGGCSNPLLFLYRPGGGQLALWTNSAGWYSYKRLGGIHYVGGGAFRPRNTMARIDVQIMEVFGSQRASRDFGPSDV